MPVDGPEPLVRLLGGEAFADHGVADQVGDAGAGGAGAVDHDPLVGQPLAGDPQGGGDRGQGDRGGALQVVVEGADLVGVAVQDAAGVVGGEVLPVQHRVGNTVRTAATKASRNWS